MYGLARFHVCVADHQLVFRGLEAWVCDSCGEQAYEPDDVRLMQNVMRGLELEEAPPQIMNVEEACPCSR